MKLEKGNRGSAVKKLQQALKDKGYLKGSVDGVFGSQTKTAVKKYQKDNKMTVNGIADTKMLESLGLQTTSETSSAYDIPPVHGTAKLSDWWTELQYVFPKGKIAVITDVDKKVSWREKRFAGKNHADIQPLTKADTAKLKRVYGGGWSWKRRAVFVTIDGVNYAASIHGYPHGGSNLSNNFPGHHCLHGLNSRTHGTNKVDANHQKMVQKAAKATL